ncbi:MAG: histidinol-phosphatase [Acidimicrobiia bacterium]
MTGTGTGADLELALELADLADGVTRPRFRARDLHVETKPDLTPVTEADRNVEQALRERLTATRPDDAVLGEEFGTTGTGVRRWIIDPIDGTKNFVRGVPVWASLVALEVDRTIAVGVVSAPALGRRWWAARGQGAFADGASIRVSAVADIDDAHLAYDSVAGWDTRGLETEFLDLARRCWRTRGFGDFWSHMLVAEGACDIAVEPQVALWDLAPLLVIVEEAGGRFTDLGGDARADGGSAVSTNALLHDEVLDAFRI